MCFAMELMTERRGGLTAAPVPQGTRVAADRAHGLERFAQARHGNVRADDLSIPAVRPSYASSAANVAQRGRVAARIGCVRIDHAPRIAGGSGQLRAGAGVRAADDRLAQASLSRAH